MSFQSEIEVLERKTKNYQENLGTLQPFLVDKGILRVGGRLGNSHSEED